MARSCSPGIPSLPLFEADAIAGSPRGPCGIAVSLPWDSVAEPESDLDEPPASEASRSVEGLVDEMQSHRERLDTMEERIGLRSRQLEQELRTRLAEVEKQMHDAQRHQCLAIQRVEGLMEERRAKNEEVAQHVIGLLVRIEAMDTDRQDETAADALRLLRLEGEVEDCRGRLASLLEQERGGQAVLQEHMVRFATLSSRVDAQGEQLRLMVERLQRADVHVRLDALQASLDKQDQKQQKHAERLAKLVLQFQSQGDDTVESADGKVAALRAEVANEVEQLRSDIKGLSTRLLILAKENHARSLRRGHLQVEPEDVCEQVGVRVSKDEGFGVIAGHPAEDVVEEVSHMTRKDLAWCKLGQLQGHDANAVALAREIEVIRGGLRGAEGGS